MKRLFKSISVTLLFTTILITGISGCGSELNSNNTDKKIKVTIPFDLSEKSLQKSYPPISPPSQGGDGEGVFYGPAPSNIHSIRVEVLYPNGVKISKQIDVAGGTYVEVNMEVDEGTNIYFYAFAYDGYGGTGNLLYSGASPPQTLKNNMSYDIVINMSPAKTPPSVVSVTPSNGAAGVATNTSISATFSETMDPSTIDTTTFMISGGATGTVTYSGQITTFTPSASLSPSTTYTATITTGVRNSIGIPLSSNYSWSFTTGSSSDTTPPTVSSVSPANGATNVPAGTASGIITIIFSEAMASSSLTTSTITLSPNPGYSVNYSGGGSTTATVVPTTFSLNTTYTVTVTTGVKDSAGNAMASAYSWSFTTEGGADTTPPGVSSTSPSSGATGVATNTSISVTFNEAMDSSTITTSTFTISGGVTGSVSYSAQTATFTPSASLSPSTTYTATITTGVKDSAGNAMTSSYSWSFTTGSSSDTTPPTVSSHTPVSGATSVPTSSIITIIFSEAMTSSSITTSTIILSPNPGYSVNYSGGTTATITPTTLSSSTTYTVTVKTGVKDSAGNAMISDYTWSFTTAGGGDTTPPGVSSVSPSSGATDVSLNTSISATFSETMDPTTITTSTFTISGGVTGTVTYANKTATFTPSAYLAYPATYTATITTGVKDSAGNAMTSSYSWSFSTSLLTDTTTPTVSSHTPVSGATSVPTSSIITIIFSEAMDGSSLTTSTITLSPNPGYSVNYSSGSTTATVVPTTFSLNITYTATITTGVKDSAGNAMASAYSWSFTTSSQ